MEVFVRLILWKFSLIYRLGIFIWDQYWRKGRKVKLACKVISIGNITVGGTGKTPIASLLANLSAENGHNTAIVARGYKRQAKGLTEVSNNSSWLEVGDEPLEVYQNTRGVRVYVDESKTRSAIKAAENGARVVFVDDGFQHRKLHRDIDIVCLDWSKPFGPGGMLPLGHLREPLKSLNRADILVWTSYDENSFPNRDSLIFRPELDQYYSSFSITGFIDIKSNEHKTIEEFNGRSVIAFCGLGNPDRFQRALARIDLIPEEIVTFADHYRYNQNDIDKLIGQAGTLDADCLVCTNKDAVKIRGFDFGDYDVYSAELEISITDEEGNDRLEDLRRQLGI
ncbi:MAG: tetraacyldisaccharide 4'-kinase [candidate division Zixibacteria bacterium]|nr:tetraacyldisaccharide 4'-kinase [candidate division Zixibacteria bacterium]